MGDEYRYRFVTNWRVRASCEDVSDVLEDTDRISFWWPSVYRECAVVERGGEHALGRRVEVTTKGFLPYLLRWRYTVVEQNYPHGSRIVAGGDLEGDGRWTLRQIGDDTDVTYEWTVRANHAFVRRFSWLLRPLFAANHNWTMRDGLRGLQRELAARSVTRR
jgi:Polyketide cyclase / dehydrase and lipid transport